MTIFTMAACAFLLWMLQAALYHTLWKKNLGAALSFSCPGTTEGGQVILQETVTNAKALPLPVLHVKFQMGKYLVFTSAGNSSITDNNYRSDIFSCMPWQEIRRSLEISCKKRGYYTISQVQLVSYDLFFSGRLVTSLPVDAALYVYPREIPLEKLNLPFRSLMGQMLARRSLLSDPFEIQSVRPYQSYDSYRSINWKATAKTGQLKVNVCTPTASWQVAFLLDMDSDKIWKDESLTEEAIRLCATYSLGLLKEGIPVSIQTNGTGCLKAGAGPGHGQAVMEFLARIQPLEKGHASMEHLLQDMALSPDAARSMVYILISPKQRESMAQAFGHLCRQSPGCQWILPMRPGQELSFRAPSHISIFPWEVPYDYSQAS